MFTAWAIILAAGKGTRTGLDIPKQFITWRARPLYWNSALAFAHRVQGLVFVFNSEYCARETARIRRLALMDNLRIPWKVTSGGQRRQDSSRNGIGAVPPDCEKILIHDSARPFISETLISRVLEAISPARPCIVPAVSLADTIKLTSAANSGLVETTLPRERLVACQTPQGFWASFLRDLSVNEDVTDDAAMFERMGYPVHIVRGEESNIKITDRDNLKLLFSDACPETRTGFGYDAHRYGGQRPLKLGGVVIPADITVDAHSDGDVLLHALMDALLGIACLGDIGRYFPDTDPAYTNISSEILLERVLAMLAEAGWRVTHADLTIVAQKPRLAPFAAQIAEHIALLLHLSPSQVNFKATTEEKLGFTGNGQGIKAYAVATGAHFGQPAQDAM